MSNLTPIVDAEVVPMTMSFPDAIKKIMDGKRVTRISWANKDYGCLKDGWLTIFTKGDFFTWKVNAGDLEGNDWIVVTESN